MKRRLGALLLVAAAGVGASRCGQVILTAPQASTLRMEANPPFIEANGGVSVISVAVVEPAGTVVPDGTVVQFFTTLGRIDEQGKTNDGVVRVNLVATATSGVASVTALSGGEAPPASSTSTSSTPGSSTTSITIAPTTTTRPGGGGGGGPRLGVAEGQNSATMTVAIGSSRPTRLVLSADVTRLSAGRPVNLTAFVFDASGNPVANVPVFFRLEVPTATERLDSAGNPLFSDFNGAVTDRLTTTAATPSAPRNVTVVGTTANGVTGSVVVTVS